MTAEEHQEQIEAAIAVTVEGNRYIKDELLLHDRRHYVACLNDRLASYDEKRITRYQAKGT